MKKILLPIILSVAWFSCEDNSDCSPDPNQTPISVSAEIIDLPVLSKTSISNGSTAAWISGDVIGLFCSQTLPAAATNVPFTASGSGPFTWASNPVIYWADATTSHTFLAYAPYASGNTAAAVKLPTLTGQTGTVNPAMDLLISNNLGTTGTARPSDGLAALTFTHALSLVEFDIVIDASITAGATLPSFTLAAGASDKMYTTDASSTIALSDATITLGSSGTINSTKVIPATAPTLSTIATKVYVLILPGTFTAPTLQIDLKEGSAAAIAVPAKSIGTTTFAAKTKYTYTVTVTRTALSISTPTITDWATVSGNPINPGI